MATADHLVELMYSWMHERKVCAEKLSDLADELESLREICNMAEAVGNSISVVGAGCLIGAGLFTIATGGLAAPVFGGLGVLCSIFGTGATVATFIIEKLCSSKVMKEAQKADQRANKISQKIDQLFEKLKDECPRGSAQDLHTMKKMLGALSRRCGLPASSINMDLLLNYRLLSYMPALTISNTAALGAGICLIYLVGIYSIFAFRVNNKALKKLLNKGTKKIVKMMMAKGVKILLKSGVKVLGGVLALAFSLPNAIDNWKDLIKDNNVTEASQSLRDNSKTIDVVVDDLQEKLGSICKELKELKEVMECIENSDRPDREALLRFAMKYCQDPEVKTWLEDRAKTKVFLRLVDVFQMAKTDLDQELEEIDITFVAHGRISEPLMSASWLMPLPTILDVVLYSPWNCPINGNVAYGIAAGTIKPEYREFECVIETCPEAARDNHNHTPSQLPIKWNKMSEAQEEAIPKIMVQSITDPKDGAWEYFIKLKDENGLPDHGRVVIPFILPGYENIEVSFELVTLAMAVVLVFSLRRARVHLAACLNKDPPNSNLSEEYLTQQYAYTIDHTYMTTTNEVFPTAANLQLFQNLKAMFG